ncbi:uncharacterized protein RSE6_07322 [Rhynchosporium secalis]|uniref:Uncharacterized protein n=1 Tax=Rhynchosporium secalis TaxID=38038 RepID=A0A1E1MCQ4_RHYSE|nr:uncharacterized protein RSE6_07322 [Rhynchosporium secalis]
MSDWKTRMGRLSRNPKFSIFESLSSKIDGASEMKLDVWILSLIGEAVMSTIGLVAILALQFEPRVAALDYRKVDGLGLSDDDSK